MASRTALVRLITASSAMLSSGQQTGSGSLQRQTRLAVDVADTIPSGIRFYFLTVVPANTASLLRKCTVGRRFRRTRETRRSVQRIRLTTSATAEVNRLNNSSA